MESLKCFQCFSKVIASKCFAYRESGVGNIARIIGEGCRAEARKLSNIEIKFISWHQKQLPLVLRVCKIGDILKFFAESIDNGAFIEYITVATWPIIFVSSHDTIVIVICRCKRTNNHRRHFFLRGLHATDVLKTLIRREILLNSPISDRICRVGFFATYTCPCMQIITPQRPNRSSLLNNLTCIIAVLTSCWNASSYRALLMAVITSSYRFSPARRLPHKFYITLSPVWPDKSYFSKNIFGFVRSLRIWKLSKTWSGLGDKLRQCWIWTVRWLF